MEHGVPVVFATNSNTTLVKVKFDYPTQTTGDVKQFKYNSC